MIERSNSRRSHKVTLKHTDINFRVTDSVATGNVAIHIGLLAVKT